MISCLDDEPADYYLSELLALLTSVKSARITDGGMYDGRMGKSSSYLQRLSLSIIL